MGGCFITLNTCLTQRVFDKVKHVLRKSFRVVKALHIAQMQRGTLCMYFFFFFLNDA